MGGTRVLASGLLILFITSTVLLEMSFVDFADDSTSSTGTTFERALSSYLRASSIPTTDHHRVTQHHPEPNHLLSSYIHPPKLRTSKATLSSTSSSNMLLAIIAETNKVFELEGEEKDDNISGSSDNDRNSSGLEKESSKDKDAATEMRKISLFPEPGSGVVQILLLPPMKLAKRSANAKHLMQDGVMQSPLLTFTEDFSNFDGNVVWVLDLLAARNKWLTQGNPRHWCSLMQSKIQEAQQGRKAANLTTEWPIVIIDNRDFPVISNCTEIGEAVGDHNVRYSFRSLVVNREWSNLKPWVKQGEPLDPATFPSKYHYRHRPIGVRTDTVAAVESLVATEFGMKLCDAIEELDRPIDVSYFWEFSNFTRDDSLLRDTVYQILKDVDKRKPWNMVIGLRGENAVDGRKKVSSEYVDTLLHSKVVVVAQRDEWEDHYRLFEAVVGGALVLTDKMLSLPRGMKHGESVVEYTDADDLRNKLEFYLTHHDERIRVARQGRFVAMSNHRSWHHMEEIVFGAPVTVCSKNKGSRCPYIVHTSQIHEDCE